MLFRIGQGFDIHNIVEDIPNATRPLILGGVCISKDIAVEAHSDGDTLIHALIDAILGALGQEDIGDLFPPHQPEWEGISSEVLLQEVLKRTAYEEVWKFGNIDITLVLQSPKLGIKKMEIKESLRRILKLQDTSIPIAIKAKTFEKTSSQIWVYASVLLTLP